MPDILLIANRTCPCPIVLDTVRERTGPDGHVLVVAPALNSRMKHYTSDTDEAAEAAAGRLDEALAYLAGAGVRANGSVGDADPLQAIQDAVSGFPADEIVISTFPAEDSHWLEKDLLERAQDATGLPVVHVTSRYGLSAAA